MLLDVSLIDEVQNGSDGREDGIIEFASFLIRQANGLNKCRRAVQVLLEKHRGVNPTRVTLQNCRAIFQEREDMRSNFKVVTEQIVFRESLIRPVDSIETRHGDSLTISIENQIAFRVFEPQKLVNGNSRAFFLARNFDSTRLFLRFFFRPWHGWILTFGDADHAGRQKTNVNAKQGLTFDGATMKMKMVFIIGLLGEVVMFKAVTTFLFLLIAAGITQAQSGAQAQLTGKVLDTERATISQATVSIQAAHFQQLTVTDQEGVFAFSLPAGEYAITVQAKGFEAARRQVRLRNGERALLDVVLPVASSTATVTIMASDAVGYRTDSISTATKTLTALQDTPQSITVLAIPQRHLRNFRFQFFVLVHRPKKFVGDC